MNFWNSFYEFSVKFGIFSETSCEITHFSPWIRLVPIDVWWVVIRWLDGGVHGASPWRNRLMVPKQCFSLVDSNLWLILQSELRILKRTMHEYCHKLQTVSYYRWVKNCTDFSLLEWFVTQMSVCYSEVSDSISTCAYIWQWYFSVARYWCWLTNLQLPTAAVYLKSVICH